jgi:hypothetical protein
MKPLMMKVNVLEIAECFDTPLSLDQRGVESLAANLKFFIGAASQGV